MENTRSGVRQVKTFIILVMIFTAVFIITDYMSIHSSSGVVTMLSRYLHYIFFMLPFVVGYQAYKIESDNGRSYEYKIFITTLITLGTLIFSFFLYAFLNTKVHLWIGGEL